MTMKTYKHSVQAERNRSEKNRQTGHETYPNCENHAWAEAFLLDMLFHVHNGVPDCYTKIEQYLADAMMGGLPHEKKQKAEIVAIIRSDARWTTIKNHYKLSFDINLD